MRKILTALAAAAALAILPGTALAKPVVSVSVGLPRVGVVIAPTPAPVAVARPVAPGPNYVWVDGHWRSDAFGRRVWVAGYWAHRPIVVARPAPRVVIVHR